MRVIDRSEFLDGAAKFSGENPGCMVVAGATSETEAAFLAALKGIARDGDGIATRMGYRSFIAVTSPSAKATTDLLRASCEGIWCHFLASVGSTRSIADAIHEVEWRSMKGLSNASACDIEILP